MPKSRQTPSLRVKTGCQTCRKRKKKCDERRPVCQRCASIGWTCEWPTSEELVDRRHTSVRQHESKAIIKVDPKAEEPQVWEQARVCMMSMPTDYEALSLDIQPVVFKHFIDKYYSLILLPNCHPEYYWDLFHQIQQLMPECAGLQQTVLANAASHLYSSGKSAQMKELALNYYSRALRALQELLGAASELENHNGLLITVMLLYTLGSTSQGTYSDNPRHLNAAVKLVSLRLFKKPMVITRPFDRLVLESVLFSMFLVSMGLWSDEFNPHDTFDSSFWLRAEESINHINVSPPEPLGHGNPVVGVPISLLKLLVMIKQLRHNLGFEDINTIRTLKSEVSAWETSLTCTSGVEGAKYDELEHSQPPPMAQDAASLFIVCVSVLTEQMLAGDTSTTTPSPYDPDSWKLRLAATILQRYHDDKTWSMSFNATNAVYTIGFFMTRTADIDLVRQDLQRRWDLTKFGHILRYRKDLEATWAKRGHGG